MTLQKKEWESRQNALGNCEQQTEPGLTLIQRGGRDQRGLGSRLRGHREFGWWRHLSKRVPYLLQNTRVSMDLCSLTE